MLDGSGDVPCLDLGPFRMNPLPPYIPPDPSLPVSSGRFALPGLEGSWDELVAAVLVLIGGGRIGVATREDEVEEVVVVDRDEDDEAFRWIEGDPGSLGNAGYGGVGGADADGVGMGETWIALAMV